MGKQAIGKTKGGKIHMICTDENNPVIFSLSPGNAGDAPCGRELIKKLGKQKKQRYLLMDKAYEGDNTRLLAQSLNFKPIVPPKSNRKIPWIFDKVLYKSRNNIERLIKRFRRIFTRYDKLDSLFLFFIYFAFIFDSLIRVNRP